MNKLYKCRTCAHSVDLCAKLCPNCGASTPVKSVYYATGIISIIFLMTILIFHKQIFAIYGKYFNWVMFN